MWQRQGIRFARDSGASPHLTIRSRRCRCSRDEDGEAAVAACGIFRCSIESWSWAADQDGDGDGESGRGSRNGAPGRPGLTRQSCRRRETLDSSARSWSPVPKALAARHAAQASRPSGQTGGEGLQQLMMCFLLLRLRQSRAAVASLCFQVSSLCLCSPYLSERLQSRDRALRGEAENGKRRLLL